MSSDLAAEMTAFSDGFENTIVEIHKIAGEIATGCYNKKKAESAIAKAGSAKAQIDKIIRTFMANPVPGKEMNDLFIKFIVSYRAQIDSAIATLDHALDSPPESMEDAYERKFDELAGGESQKIISEVMQTVEELRSRAQSGTKEAPASSSSEEESEEEEEEEEEKKGEDKKGLVWNDVLGCYMMPLVAEDEDESADSSSSEEEEEEEEEEEKIEGETQESPEYFDELKQMLG